MALHRIQAMDFDSLPEDVDWSVFEATRYETCIDDGMDFPQRITFDDSIIVEKVPCTQKAIIVEPSKPKTPPKVLLEENDDKPVAQFFNEAKTSTPFMNNSVKSRAVFSPDKLRRFEWLKFPWRKQRADEVGVSMVSPIKKLRDPLPESYYDYEATPNTSQAEGSCYETCIGDDEDKENVEKPIGLFFKGAVNSTFIPGMTILVKRKYAAHESYLKSPRIKPGDPSPIKTQRKLAFPKEDQLSLVGYGCIHKRMKTIAYLYQPIRLAGAKVSAELRLLEDPKYAYLNKETKVPKKKKLKVVKPKSKDPAIRKLERQKKKNRKIRRELHLKFDRLRYRPRIW